VESSRQHLKRQPTVVCCCMKGTLPGVDINSLVSRSLSAPMLMVLDANKRSAEELVQLAKMKMKLYKDHEADIAGVLVNQVMMS
jgi:BioD-like phosphotransacetylase family protein